MDIMTIYAMVIIVIVVGAVIVCKEKGFNYGKDTPHPVHESLVRESK